MIDPEKFREKVRDEIRDEIRAKIRVEIRAVVKNFKDDVTIMVCYWEAIRGRIRLLNLPQFYIYILL